MNRKILIDLLDDFAFGSHDIEQTADRITELYKQDQALQLQQTGVSKSVCDHYWMNIGMSVQGKSLIVCTKCRKTKQTVC